MTKLFTGKLYVIRINGDAERRFGNFISECSAYNRTAAIIEVEDLLSRGWHVASVHEFDAYAGSFQDITDYIRQTLALSFWQDHNGEELDESGAWETFLGLDCEALNDEAATDKRTHNEHIRSYSGAL
jgi:hypothetical protein